MDIIEGTTVYLNVLLQCSFLCCFASAVAASVNKSESRPHAEVGHEFNKWPVDVEDHCVDNCVASIVEPHLVEVSQVVVEDFA